MKHVERCFESGRPPDGNWQGPDAPAIAAVGKSATSLRSTPDRRRAGPIPQYQVQYAVPGAMIDLIRRQLEPRNRHECVREDLNYGALLATVAQSSVRVHRSSQIPGIMRGLFIYPKTPD